MQLRKGVGFPSTHKGLDLYRKAPCWRDPNLFYRRLGLTPEASDEEIKKAGRELLRRYHPDGSSPDPEAFLAVEEAYRCLRDNRNVYDMTPDNHVMVTARNHNDPDLVHMPHRYEGWSYFSEVPRATDDAVALWAYEHYLEQALATPTTMPRIAVALIQGKGTPWLDDGLIYVPVSEIQGKL